MAVNRTRAIALLFTLFSLGFLSTTALSAAELYIDTNAGDDNQVGDIDEPFATIQMGLRVARPGDVILVNDGDYSETVDTIRAGRFGAPITLRALNRRRVIIRASGNVLTARHPYHVFEGLVIDGEMGPGRAVRVREAGSHLVFRDLEVRYSGNNCMDLNGEDILIEGSEIHHCLRWDPETSSVRDAHGITADSVEDLTIRDCDIHHFSGDAIQFSPGRQPWDRVLVERTRMWISPLSKSLGNFRAGQLVGENAFDSKTEHSEFRSRIIFRDVEAFGFRGVIGNQAAFNVKENVDFTIDRATIWGSQLAFRLRGPAKARIRNVVTYKNDFSVRYEKGVDSVLESVTFADEAIFKDGGGNLSTSIVIRNALFANVRSLPEEAADSRSVMLGSTVFFVDALNHNYHLLADQAPIDSGEKLTHIGHDRDGMSRPLGKAYDVGAYEWGHGAQLSD